MAFDWKDIETIDQSLAGSLQAVNSSLASFFAAIITVAWVIILSNMKSLWLMPPTVLYFLTSWFPPPSLVLLIGSWRLDIWIQDAICEEWNPTQGPPFSLTLENYSKESSLSGHFLPKVDFSIIFTWKLIQPLKSDSTSYRSGITC